MKQEHTPGPWRIGTSGSIVGVNYSMLARKKGGWVNILHGNEYHGTETRATPAEAKANSRLIAAAPELLNALVNMLDAVVTQCEYEEGSATAKWVRDSRAAIAKATGGAV